MKIKSMQCFIMKQETTGLSAEAAEAMENLIKRQVIQVFMKGLGELKTFIKARNPISLDKAIQAAREKERNRNLNRGAKYLLKDNSRPIKTN